MEITVSLDSSFNVPATIVVKSSFSFIKQIPDILFHPSLNTSANTVVLLYWQGIHSTNPQFSSVQFSCSVVFDSLLRRELQQARPPCPSPIPRVHPNSCPSNPWCPPAISSSVGPFSSCPQSLPASQSLFQWVNSSHEVAKVLEFQL